MGHKSHGIRSREQKVFEANVLEYDRYEPPLGPRLCHRYLKTGIYYVNHMLLLLVILRLMVTFIKSGF